MSETTLNDDERSLVITTITLDVSAKHLNEVPKTIKNFTNIEFLYISSNQIKAIPPEFFITLPQLKWLDFRNNKLQTLPDTIGLHRQLRTLLVQGNQLKELPIQLGNIPTLTGLNIADNPIVYPPPQVIKHGTQDILLYLRTELQRQDLLSEDVTDRLSDLKLTDNDGYLGSDDEGCFKTSSTSLNHSATSLLRKKKQSSVSLYNRSATLHRAPDFKRDKKWTSAGDLTTSKPRLPKPRKAMFRSANPIERVMHTESKIKKVMKDFEEKKLIAKKREENSRTELIMQRIRDREALKEWRQDNQNTSPRSPPPRKSPSNIIPYGSVDVKVLKQTSVQLEKEESLQARIKEHANKLREYHYNHANAELDNLGQAQSQLDQARDMAAEAKRMQNEYRFTAFTGELI